MGNNQTAQNSSEYIHQRLGPVNLMTSNIGGEQVTVMQKVYPVTNEKEYEQWSRSVSKIKNTQTSQVLFLPIKNHYEKGGICGSSGHATLLFQDYIFVLDNEIKNRDRLRKHFLETEIWYLLYNMIRAAKEFEKIGQKVGDIKPANIVINEDGQIKIISTRTRPGELTNFDKAIESRTEQIFLAPQECNEQSIKTAHYPSGVDRLSAEIFSIGVTLLEALTLRDCNELYRRSDNYEFDRNTLQHFKSEIHEQYEQYSPELKYLILKMLDFNPEVRPKASVIYADLFPYETEILNLEEFQFATPHANQNQSQNQNRITYGQTQNPIYSHETNYQYPNIAYEPTNVQIKPPYQGLPSQYNNYPPLNHQIPLSNYQHRQY